MATIDQHLRVLELERETSHAAVKESYRRLVKVWHPDRFTHDAELRSFAENRCKQINLAYEFLLSVLPEQLKKEEGERELPPIQIHDCQYRGSVVAQIVTELPNPPANRQWVEINLASAKRWGIELKVENAPIQRSGVQLAMIFDSAKRVIRFPSSELIDIEFPMFALATICVRDFTFNDDWPATIKKGLEFCGWDGSAKPPVRNYFEAEYRLCKKVAELDRARVIARDDRFMEDLRVWFKPKDLTDVARWIGNRAANGRR